jgi:hypothetical protein
MNKRAGAIEDELDEYWNANTDSNSDGESSESESGSGDATGPTEARVEPEPRPPQKLQECAAMTAEANPVIEGTPVKARAGAVGAVREHRPRRAPPAAPSLPCRPPQLSGFARQPAPAGSGGAAPEAEGLQERRAGTHHGTLGATADGSGAGQEKNQEGWGEDEGESESGEAVDFDI